MAENEKIGGLAALGAGGRRFESFCPDLKIKELQAIVTPIFLLILKICTRFARKLSEMDKKKRITRSMTSQNPEFGKITREFAKFLQIWQFSFGFWKDNLIFPKFSKSKHISVWN